MRTLAKTTGFMIAALALVACDKKEAEKTEAHAEEAVPAAKVEQAAEHESDQAGVGDDDSEEADEEAADEEDELADEDIEEDLDLEE